MHVRYRRGILLWLTAVLLVPHAGCKKKEPSVDIVDLEGTVEKVRKIDADTTEITVRYYNENKAEMVGSGLITPETEIVIDGVLSKAGDIREGEPISGQVRIEKDGQQRRMVAIKINISRPTSGGDG